MTRWIVTVLLTGCVTQEAPTITTKELVGAYRLTYEPVVGAPIDFERERVVFNSRTTSPECCFGIWRRSRTTLELAIGNLNPSPASCAALMQVRIHLDGITAAAPQTVEVGAATTRAYLFYQEPTPPCPRALDPHGERAVGIELVGQLTLPVFHCQDEPHELGCALIAKGSWTVRSADGRFTSNGWFESNDAIAPLTF